MYHVYIIQSSKTTGYYIRYTENIAKRLEYHNSGLNRTTRKKGLWVLVYKEEYGTKREALIRERFLKKQKNKDFYRRLITGRSSDG